MKIIHKHPRLYVKSSLCEAGDVALENAHIHYLKNVLRLQEGGIVRIFNGKDGEWLGKIRELSKKTGFLEPKERIIAQPEKSIPIHLLFAPIKKSRMDFLIEKAVELGVTDLHPVLTARTELRQINYERMTAQIIEASEQCERLDIPLLHPLLDLKNKLSQWDSGITIQWCSERSGAPHLAVRETSQNYDFAFLVGPEGGFDDQENSQLARTDFIKPVSLGKPILRAETASILCLAWAWRETTRQEMQD